MNTQDVVEVLNRLPDHLINTNKAVLPEKPYWRCAWVPNFGRFVWIKVIP